MGTLKDFFFDLVDAIRVARMAISGNYSSVYFVTPSEEHQDIELGFVQEHEPEYREKVYHSTLIKNELVVFEVGVN